MVTKTAIDSRTGLPVYADGSPAQMGLVDGKPTLHVLPKLWLPYEGLDVNKPMSIWLESIKIPALGIDDGGKEFVPSRPYPNVSYVVFGNGKRMGWFIPLDKPLPDVLDIEYIYILQGDFETSSSSFYLEVIHNQRLIIKKSEIGLDCYSTEQCVPVFICYDEFERVFKKHSSEKVKSFGHPEADEGYYVDGWDLVTEEILSPLPNRHISALQFEDYEPFHSKKQQTKLTKYTKSHNRNAKIEAPFSIISSAISQLDAWDGKADPLNLPENHSAMKTLCEWWNSHPDVKDSLKRAKACQIWVRLNDSNEYHDIDLEVPAIPITGLDRKVKECAARIGDHFLVVFMLGYQALNENDEGFTASYLVNGAIYESRGCSKEEFLPGWETLGRLRSLSDRYPDIVKMYANG